MTPSEFAAWAAQQDAADIKDAMGWPWTSWLLAVRRPDGSLTRNAAGHQIYETQAEYKARTSVPVGQTLELFA